MSVPNKQSSCGFRIQSSIGSVSDATLTMLALSVCLIVAQASSAQTRVRFTVTPCKTWKRKSRNTKKTECYAQSLPTYTAQLLPVYVRTAWLCSSSPKQYNIKQQCMLVMFNFKRSIQYRSERFNTSLHSTHAVTRSSTNKDYIQKLQSKQQCI